MDIVNFPGIIAEHGLLTSAQVSLAKDLILIGKQMGPQRDGTQYENMAITVAQFANLVSGGGNETLAQTLALGNVTGGNNIFISNGDNIIYNSGAFTGTLSDPVLAGNVVWTLPSISGTIALLTDIPGPQTLASVIAAGNTTGPDDIAFDSGQGSLYQEGAGGRLVSLVTTVARTWSLPDNSGIIALLSDIPSSVNSIYSADDIIVDPTRNVQINTTLNFNHGAAGINGYFQLSSGGYVFNQTLNAGQFFEYNHNTAVFTLQTAAATVTGVRSVNTAGVNPDSLVELFAGSNQRAYLNIGSTTDFFDFYVNNTAKYAGGILGGSGAFNGSWGFGIQPTASAKVHIMSENGQGFGTIIQSMNLSPAESILQVRDAANFNVIDVRATGVTFIGNQLRVGYLLGSIPSVGALGIKGSDSSFLTETMSIYDGSNNPLWRMQNNGNIGHNIAPNALDRMFIRAGAGYNGAINISANNLADNGYSILAQGGTGAVNYNGIGSDVAVPGTGTNRAFNGSSLLTGGSRNIGGQFRARNGTDESIAVYAIAAGGDSVDPTGAVFALWASVESTEATNRIAGYFDVSQATNVNNANTNGVLVELAYISAVANEAVIAINGDASVAGAGVVNTAGSFNANGAGAINNAIISQFGFIVFGANANANGSLVEASGDVEVIGAGTGFILESPDTTRWRIAVSNLGVLSAAAA